MASSAQITMNIERVLRVMRTAGHETAAQQAAAIGIDYSTWTRHLNGHTAPSPKVIRGILRAFPNWPFEELFNLADDDADQSAEAVLEAA